MRGLALIAIPVALLLAGCGGTTVAPTPETVVGTIADDVDDRGAEAAAGERGGGQDGLRERRLQRLPHAEGGGLDRHRRPEPRPGRSRRSTGSRRR